jgi:FkbM family methyltransferase
VGIVRGRIRGFFQNRETTQGDAKVRHLFERSVKSLLKPLGYEMRRKSPPLVANAFKAQQRILAALGRVAPTVLDVGANVGGTAKRYRARFPEAEIYCFEPFPENIEKLRQRFSGDPKIHIVPKAVGERSGRRTFHVNEYDATNSLLPRPAAQRRYYPSHAGPKGTIEVEVTSLDEFAADNRIGSVDILKLDIQGGEAMALRGARGLLERGAISAIYTEVMFVAHYEGGPMFHELWSLIAEFGYSLFNIYATHSASNGQLRYGDALFVSESVRSEAIDRFPEEP